MRGIRNSRHHYKKKLFTHAQKHHKKYLWGAIGFFGIIKLFSFLLLSTGIYLSANASMTETINIQIAGNTQEQEPNTISFLIEEISDYTVQDISFQTKMTTQNRYIDVYLFTDEEKNKDKDKNIYTLENQGDDLWNLQPQDIDTITKGGTIPSLRYMQTPEGIRSLEQEVLINITYTPQEKNQTENPQEENQSEEKEKEDEKEEYAIYEIIDKDLDTKENKEHIKKNATIQNIILTSKDKKIKVHIPKDTHIIDKENNGFEGIIIQPQEINKDDIVFDPQDKILYVFDVGDQNQSIHFLNKDQQKQTVTIRVEVDPERFFEGQEVMIYYSQDKNTRNTLSDTSLIQKNKENNLYVDIHTTHLTTFLIGEKDPFNWFLGNNKCEEIEDIPSNTTNIYACLEGSNIAQVKVMRFSNKDEANLGKQLRSDFKNGQSLSLAANSEGEITRYAQYGYDTKVFSTVIDTLKVYTKTEGKTSLSNSQTIPQGEILDISNVYKIIQSKDGVSKIIINTAGTTGNITVGINDWDGNIIPPTKVTDGRAASKGESGLANGFLPQSTYLVGDDVSSLTLDNNQVFSIKIKLTDPDITAGMLLDIYYSYDGNTRTNTETQCLTYEDNENNIICEFESTHLSLFAVGSIARNNLEFVTQDFWDQNPTTGQIFDTFFGTGGNPSAYTINRSSQCTPTTLAIVNPGTYGAETFPANTVVVFNSGNYTMTGAITMGNCTALIGNGDVTITKNLSSYLFYSTNKTGVIIDNISINGNNIGQYLFWGNGNIYNFTLNDIQIYNNGTTTSHYPIYINGGNNVSIHNSQIFNNPARGIYNLNSKTTTIDNVMIYNNGYYGVYSKDSYGLTINNSQIYNNASIGIYTYQTTGITINNSQIYNNQTQGLYFNQSRNIDINNTKSFNNNSYQLYFSSSDTGYFYGNNIIYGTYGIQGTRANGSAVGSLGRTAGSVSTTNLGYNCDFVTTPKNSYGTGLYSTSNCNTIGRVTSRSADTQTKYLYGNNMLSGDFVLRQTQPIKTEYLYVYSNTGPPLWLELRSRQTIRSLSDTPYHGHRFIGEYYNPSDRDINIPVALFSGETPPQGENIIDGTYSGHFTTRAYIYEPNLFSLNRREDFPTGTTNYSLYDSGLIFMANFDNIAEIGEDTTTVKDLSLYDNRGKIYDNVDIGYTGSSKRGGAARFNFFCFIEENYGYIGGKTPLIRNNIISIALRFNHSMSSNGALFRENGETNAAGAFIRIEPGSNRIRAFMGHGSTVGTYADVISSSDYGDNQWHHLVVVFESGNSKMYIDTTLVDSSTETYGTVYSNNKRNLGRRKYSSMVLADQFYVGDMDEVRIYNRVLTSGEIEHLYNSNLSAKADHREYEVNYTGVQSRPFGTYNYGFTTTYPLTDIDSNTGTATGYVVKHLNCGTGFSTGITRDNDNFLNSGFRNQSPTECDIIYALYGTGSDGNDTTAYTEYRTGRTGQCNQSNMNIIYTQDISLSPLTNYTIYVVTGDNSIHNDQLTMGDCTSIISNTQTGTHFYSSVQLPTKGTIAAYKAHHTIIDNIHVDGNNNGIGGSHDPNRYGIFIKGGYNYTIHNFTISDSNLYGIESVADNVYIQSGIINTTTRAINMQAESENIYIDNIQAYDNSETAIYALKNNNIHIVSSTLYNNTKSAIFLSETQSGNIDNCSIYSNGDDGIHLTDASQISIQDTQIFSNKVGIYIDTSDTITIDNTQIYDNANPAIYIANANDHITLNNLHLFNNGRGIQTNETSNKDYISLNNSQIYNNNNDGLLLYRTNYFTINNTHIYNNSGNGLYFAGNYNNTGVLNNLASYNNGGYGILLYSGNYTRYGTTTTFNNNIGGTSLMFGSLSAGNSSTYSYLGRAGGTTDTTPCMNCARTSNPKTPAPSYDRLIDTTTYPKCDRRGKNTSWTGSIDLSYRYGINLTGQKLPVFWSGTTLTGAIIGYTPSEYIAETNKLSPDYTNTTCSCSTHTFWRDNDNFIDSGFWNHVPAPTHCDIIGALYGESIDGNDETAYTENRSGNRAGQCNIENMNITYLTGGTGKIDYTMDTNTIYVLASGNYIQTGQTTLNNCTTIIGSGDTRTTKIYSSEQFIGNITILYGSNISYNIIDNLYIQGSENGRGGNHEINRCIRYNASISNTINNNNFVEGALRLNNSEYTNIYNNNVYSGGGIYIETSKNNIFKNNNIGNSLSRGLYLRISSLNTIDNMQIYNSSSDGINLYASQLNTFNNIQTYNNNGDGIEINGSSSKFNTINNAHIYNNTQDGIDFGRGNGTGNIINNTMIYNNSAYGINIDAGSTDNKYYSNLTLFENSGGNIGGTPGNLTSGSASDYPGFGRTDGEIIETGEISRDYLANPKNANNEFLLSFTGYNFTDLIGPKTFPIVEPIVISYGSGISTQIQPVIYSGDYYTYHELISSGTYDINKFIGGTTTKITGDLEIYSTVGSSSATVTGSSLSPLVTSYAVRGNTDNPYTNIPINTNTTIGFDTSSFGIKRIVGIFYNNPNQDEFLTHFEKQTEYNGCMPGRDNDNFLNDTFRGMDPNDAEIICALYGAGPGDTTAYTENRSGWDTTQCDGANMDVVYTGTLPTTWNLDSNTIYVLYSGTYNRTAATNMAECSAIISTGTAEFKKTASTYLISSSTATSHFIIDNIDLNADLQGGYIALFYSPRNTTIHKSDIHSALNTVGVYYTNTNNVFGTPRFMEGNSIINSRIYNNGSSVGYGIYFYNYAYNGAEAYMLNNRINNTQLFNNQYGIYYQNQGYSTGVAYMKNNAINNSQIYNNVYNIHIYNRANGTGEAYTENLAINNSQINNSNSRGIRIYPYFYDGGIGSVSGLVINNTNIYNNSPYGIYIQATNGLSPIQYYGSINMTGNGTNVSNMTYFITGSASNFPGIFDTGDYNPSADILMTRDHMTNPLSSNGNYLLTWDTALSSQRGRLTTYTGATTKWSYGSGTLTQIQPVLYSDSTLTEGGLFDTGNYIGSDTTKVTGELLGGDYYITSGLFITGISIAPSVSDYSIFGDVVGNFSTDINIGMNIYLDLGTLENKTLITQLRGTNNFATHFQNTAYKNIDCHANRNNDYFITGGFRDLSPSDDNIICALYGQGPGDTTAYTQYRSGRDTTQCNILNMQIIYTENLNSVNLTENTIYILTDNISTGSATKNLNNCTAIISNTTTGTTFYSTDYLSNSMLYANSKNHIIIDNISINGTGGGPVANHNANNKGISLINNLNTHLHNVTAYHNNKIGILIEGTYNYITNAYTYNNQIGTQIYGNHIDINNLNTYNNNGDGGIFVEEGCEYCSFNNIQSYNNKIGIYIAGVHRSIFNHINLYNNNICTMRINSSTNNKFNTIQAYNNNDYGLYIHSSSTNNTYYGENTLFANSGGNIGGTPENLTAGDNIASLGWTAGTLITTGTISRDILSNPINTLGNYLLPRTGTRSALIGEQSTYDTTTTQGYSYGTDIQTQTQPVLYADEDLITGQNFNETKYIGSNLTKITGELLAPIGTNISEIVISGNSLSSLVNSYSIFGNIISPIIGETKGVTTGITLDAGLGNKTLITQLRHPNTYFATHFQDTITKYPTCNGSRNNDYFITGAFRDLSPSDEHIICALFGANPTDTTAYTLNRSGQSSNCPIESINIVYTGTLPTTRTLDENTIYVLTSGSYDRSSSVNMNNCTALISSGNVELKKTLSINMIEVINKNNFIIENISINGEGYIGDGIRIQGNTQNSTINNNNIHDVDNGILYTTTNEATLSNHNIHNSYIYNNSLGIYYESRNNQSYTENSIQNITINNSHIYNNIHGIHYQNRPNGTSITGTIQNSSINNSQIYNNSAYGIRYSNTPVGTNTYAKIENNSINNSQIYNNGSFGIYYYKLAGFISGSIINNSWIFNNTNTEVFLNNATNPVKYYGNIYISGISTPISPSAGLITGYATDISGLGWTDGQIITTPFPNRNIMSNPLNEYDNYFLSRSGDLTTQRGSQTNFTGLTTSYSYGTDTLTQTQGVLYSGSTLITGREYSSDKYIGSNTSKITGELLGLQSYTPVYNFTVSGNSTSALVNRYSLFGNITSNIIEETKGSNTGITLTSGIGNKTVITQLYHPTDYFATHFEDTIINTPECHPSRDNDNFITGAFRALNPSDEHIICALYGENPTDTTAYTEFRSGNGCEVQNMTVEYTGTLPTTRYLNPNTIYVLASGTYNRASWIDMNNCSALISSGTVILQKTANTRGIYAQAKQHIIIDNIKIDGQAMGSEGIRINDSNNTLHNIESFNNGSTTTSIGISIDGSSANFNRIENCQSYNQRQGIVIKNGASYNVVNNCQSYNISEYSLLIGSNSSHNTFNNCQIYNSYLGFGSIGTHTTLNNITTQNNTLGIVFQGGSDNILHNITYTNNTTGLWLVSSDTSYYGTQHFIGNDADIDGAGFTIGTSSPLGRNDGSISTGTMSRDYLTNTKNTTNNYLLSRSGTFTGQRGYVAGYNGLANGYSYGSGTKTQEQPVFRSGSTLSTGGHFDTNKYIGSDLIKVTGDLSISSNNLVVTGTAFSNPLIGSYSVFGNIETWKIGQDIDTSTGIILTTGLSSNNIITQLFDGTTYFATHFQKETSPLPPIIYFTGSTPADGSTGYFNNFKPQIEMITTGGMHSFIYTFNGINYSYYDSGLVLMMNFDKRAALNETDGMIKDFSRYGNNGSGYGGVTRTNNGRRDGAYDFNGSSRIVITENQSLAITGQLSYGARFKADTLTSRAGIMSRMRVRGNGYNLQVGTTQNIACGMGIYVKTSRVPQTGVRYHALCVYSGTTMKLYVNGQYQSEGTATLNVGADPLTLGVFYTPNSLYFDGLIDEPRVRNRALTSGEIYQMRRSNLSKYDTDKRRFIDDRQCMGDGTYTYTGYVSNTFGLSDTTGRRSTISLTGYTPYAPTGYFIGSTGVSATQLTLSGQFTGHFKLEDRIGNTGRYTTIQLPLIFTGNTYSTNKIENDGNNIRLMATGVDILGGTNSGAVYISPDIATETGSLGTLHYIKRVDNRSGYYCPAGVYANKPHIYVDIPERQNPDIYSGIITLDFVQ